MNKEPKFAVSGDKEILDKLIINIRTISNETGVDEYKMQTFLYKGTAYALELDEPKAISYEIFVSLNDELVGKSVRYDNAMRFYPEDHVNHIKIIRMNDESIKIFHVYDKRSLSLNFNLIPPNITTLKSNMTFDDFIQEQNVDKDSREYIFYKDAFFKKF